MINAIHTSHLMVCTVSVKVAMTGCETSLKAYTGFAHVSVTFEYP